MFRILLTLFCFGLFIRTAEAQLQDDFSDGDFTSNPTWVGTTSDFIVNASGQLQLSAAVAGVSYLSTPHGVANINDTEWRFNIRMNFSPSASNKCEVYLGGASSNISTYPDGLFLLFGEGGSADAIRLFYRLGGTNLELMSGTAGAIANSFNIAVKVTYQANGTWSLFVDPTGGNAFVLDAITNYSVPSLQPHFGFLCTYTASNISNFFFDNVYVGPIVIDNDPPQIISATPISANELNVLFNEGVELNSAQTTTNYLVNGGMGNPMSAERDPLNLALVKLTFANSFNIGQIYNLTAAGIEDFSNNVSGTLSAQFQYIAAQQPVFGDLIINEFMCRETPSVGLPARQYVELYNRSNKYFQVNGWKLSDRTGTGTVQSGWIYPGEYLILVPTSGLVDYPGATNVTNWATLNTTGDDIRLETADGILVDFISYNNAWYQDPNKEIGGWSIERINPELNCSGSENWRASIHPLGGTPGVVNSVLDLTPDLTLPTIISSVVLAPDTLLIRFSKGMDSLALENASFSVNPLLNEQERFVATGYPNEFKIRFSQSIPPGVIHTYTLSNFQDCSGNPNTQTQQFLLPEEAEGDEIIINEILHNVLVGGADFVELYNKSNKYIDLKGWQLGNFSGGTVGNLREIDYSYVIAPNDYAVVTRDSTFQINNYPFAVSGKFIQLASLPAYNNDSSTVFLLMNDSVVDKVSYRSDWHFRLLRTQRGVSLERFNPDLPSNDKNNWHSASETVGFATPGRENSQTHNVGVDGALTLSTNTFSPDNDGFEDVLLIRYELTEPELLGDLVVYDDKGRKIRTLMDNELLGIEGVIKWDGVRDDNTKASIGIYVILFEAFNLNTGDKFVQRKVVTLAGRL
jgi:hypothetical protein